MAPAAAEAPRIWTLADTVRRVMDIAPEVRGARAAVRAREGAFQQAGAWPNPRVELRADDKIGKDAGSGGTDFTQLAVSQALPLSGRLGYQQAVAGAALDAARAERRYRQIRLETEVAQRYHTLQLASERLQLAARRVTLADELQQVGRRRQQAGDLANLDRLRLDLVREIAQQALDKAEGAYHEALSRFRAYLDLPAARTPRLQALGPVEHVPALSVLQAGLAEHAGLLAAGYRVEAARADVDLARAERLPDADLRLFREQDFLNGRRQDVTGVGVGFTLPLWDRKRGRIGQARAEVIRVQSDRQALLRDLNSRLQQSYLHLNHLVEQGTHFRAQVLRPAQQVFDLTRTAYASGEVGILALIDANTTYFESRERYLELLEMAWLEAADLRLAAGRTLLDAAQDTRND